MTIVLTRARGLYLKAKREVAENLLSQALNFLGNTSEENHRRLAGIFKRIANSEQQRLIAEWVTHWVTPGNPGSVFLKRVLKNVNPHVRKNYLAKSVVNLFFRDPKAVAYYRAELGSNPPAILLISPTMRCNYECVGCYAGEYPQDSDLPAELFDRIITEAKAMGTHFFSIVGGEPFVYRPLWDIFEKHDDCAFQVYTNSSLLNEQGAERLVKLGNVCPIISLEGFRDETDARRGKGAFDRAMKAMDTLRSKGALFGFSATVSKYNVDVVSSEEFIDLMIEKGVTYGWYFLYMPVGRDPDLSYMPTPEQRDRLRERVNRLRNTKAILLADFWGDSPLTGGCIAGGRIYCHINHKGEIEPCIFAHFTTPEMSVRDKPLLEALKAPMLMRWRKMQPFYYNTLRPCPIIDHPQALRNLVRLYGAKSTHEGGESILEQLAEGIDSYSQEMKGIYTERWDKEYASWAAPWLGIMDFPRERIEQRKLGYESRTHEPL